MTAHGNMFAKKIDDINVEVEVGEYKYKVNQWEKKAALGKFALSKKDDKTTVDVALSDKLPEDVKKEIWK